MANLANINLKIYQRVQTYKDRKMAHPSISHKMMSEAGEVYDLSSISHKWGFLLTKRMTTSTKSDDEESQEFESDDDNEAQVELRWLRRSRERQR